MKPLEIAVIADASKATAEIRSVGQAATSSSKEMKTAGDKARDFSGGIDAAGDSSSKAAGGLGDLGGALSLLPGPLGALGTGMEMAAPAIMGVTGAADLASLAGNALKASFLGQAVATAKNTVVTVASTVATYASAAASKVAAAGQWLLNAALTANPIGLVVVGIVLLVGALVLAYKRSETFRKVVTAAFAGVKAVALAVFGFLSGYFRTVFAVYRAVFTGAFTVIKAVVTTVFAGIKTTISGAMTTVKTIVSGAVAAVKRIWSGLTALVSTVLNVRDRILGAFTGAATMLTGVASDIINGFIAGLRAGWDRVNAFLAEQARRLPGWIRKPLGIGSPSKVFAGLGRDITAGLQLGIASGAGDLSRQVGEIAKDLTAGLSVTPSVGFELAAVTGSSGAARAPASITINVSTLPGFEAEAGRRVVDAIRAYQRQSGTVVLAT